MILEKLLGWAVSRKSFSKAVFAALRSNGWIPVPAHSLVKSKGVIYVYADPQRASAVDLVNKVKTETSFLLTPAEAYQLLMSAKQSLKIKGDMAEVGVYRGGSAKLMCEIKGDRPLHLFDTFSGLPHVADIDKAHFKKGEFAASMADVQQYLKKYSNVYFYQGIFPQTAGPVKDKRFAFVNLDVDTYESTKACLDFFYDRMNSGGVIISDDYNYAPGVKKAVDEFFSHKPEPIIEMLGSQCLIVKL